MNATRHLSLPAWLLSFVAMAVAFATFLSSSTSSAEIRVQLGSDANHQPDRICIRKVWRGPVEGTETKKWSKLVEEDARAGVCRANVPAIPKSAVVASDEIDFVCATNRRPATHDEPRTLVMEVDQLTELARIDLTGSLVTLFTSARSARITVLEGDYEATSAFVALDLGFISIVPTCRQILVDIPDGAGRVGFDQVPEDEMLAQCASADCGERGGVHRVLVNTGPRTKEAAASGAAHPAGRHRHRLHAWGENVDLRGEWSGNPDEVVVLLATQVEFSWQGGCLYKPCRAVSCSDEDASCAESSCQTACPMVSIPSAGIDEGGPMTDPGAGTDGRCDVRLEGDRCHYVCRSPDRSRGFSMPTEIQFAVGQQRDTWSARLVHAGQPFGGFAGRSDRQFPVTGVQALRKRGARPFNVDQANLAAADGTEFWLHIDAEIAGQDATQSQRVAVPGATCNDQLSITYFGRFQSFENRLVPLDRGAFAMPDPSELVKHHWLGFRARPVFATRFDGSSFSAGGEVEATYHHRWMDPRFWSLDIAVAYQLMTAGYEPIGFIGAVEERPELLANRTFLRARTGWHPAEMLRVSGGLGSWLRWPVHESGYALGGLSAGPEFSLGFEAWLVRSFSLSVGPSLLFEPVRAITAEPASSSAYTANWRPVLAFGLGIGFWNAL